MSRTVIRTVSVLLIVAGFVSISRAQDEEKWIRPSTKSGSAAWEFSFGGLSTLGMAAVPIVTVNTPLASGSSQANSIVGAGYKYYFSDDMALRAMLGFMTSSSGDADPTKSADGKNTSTNYGIAVGVEMHTHAVYSTSPYFGAQIAFGGASWDNQKQETTGGATTETKGSGTTFGIGVLAGFDWYFTRGMAVGAEYMLGFNSASGSYTSSSGSTSTTTDLPSASTIGISNGGNVHLVVHF